jgi:1-aminocyclopropane-1-carboxylate deaminase
MKTPFKEGVYLKDEVATYVNKNNWEVYTHYHFGGFGKWNEVLLGFMNDFYRHNNIPLDIVYTAKMMYGLKEMLSNGAFAPDARILCVHTGGLQGNSAVQQHLVYEP